MLVEEVLLIDLNFEKVICIGVLYIFLVCYMLLPDLRQSDPLVQFLDCTFETFEAQDQYRNIVE